jgi:hypothetical protein
VRRLAPGEVATWHLDPNGDACLRFRGRRGDGQAFEPDCLEYVIDGDTRSFRFELTTAGEITERAP